MSDSEKSDEKEFPFVAKVLTGSTDITQSFGQRFIAGIKALGAEAQGITRVLPEERTTAGYFSTFTLFVSANVQLNTFAAGTLGTALFGMNLRDSCLVILFFNIVGAGIPALFATFGVKTGLRQMTHTRYSYGYYGAMLIGVLNFANLIGFCTTTAIVGGQTLAATTTGMSWNVGIVIIALIALIVAFMGYKVVHIFEMYSAIPFTAAFITLAAYASRGFHSFEELPSATPGQILSFGSIIVPFNLAWAALSSDYTTYAPESSSAFGHAAGVGFGCFIGIAPLQFLGAAIQAAVATNPTWADGYATSGTAGILQAVLAPGGKFGTFILALLALSVCTNNICSVYSATFTSQVVLPVLRRVPQFILPIIVSIVYVALAVVGAKHFYAALSNFLSIIGYWLSIWSAIILVEHFYFRKGSWKRYDLESWNDPSKLPPGIAAVGTSLLSLGPVAVSMYQLWWTGPLASKIPSPAGDVGFELGFVSAGLLYFPLRYLEKRYFMR